MKTTLVLLFACLLALSAAQGGEFVGCEGSVNDRPLIDQEPKLVATVPNGQKYTVPYDGRQFYVLVLNGSSYDAGLAQGKLMRQEILQFVPDFYNFVEWIFDNNITVYMKLIPKFYRQWLFTTAATIGRGFLDINYYITLPYTSPRYNQEMQGLADGTGLSVWVFRQMNLIPELLKAACSIFGAYGKSTTTGKLLHLRSLDWESHSPMSRWPQITVYHLSEPGSIPFANIGWPALIGSLTGYNALKVGVGERLKGAPADQETRFGTPWMYVLRDALQFSTTQQEYIRYLNESHRTCSIYLGVGGENFFNIVEYSWAYLNVYDWQSWKLDAAHPHLEDVLWKAYHDGSECFKSVVQKFYGQISPETIYRYIAPLGQTGDSQVAVMDYANDIVYLMYPDPNTFVPGYSCSPIKIDLKPYFSKSVFERKIEM